MHKLIVESLGKQYKHRGREVTALQNVSFELSSSTLVTLEGPSGSGKTTLLSLLGGLDYPSNGQIEYDGQCISRLSLTHLTDFRRSKVGFIFQDYVLFDELTVLDNVILALTISQGRKAEHERQAREWIARVGLQHRSDHRPTELSGGEKQRVGVARALIKSPELLLADEPTSNLDEQNRQIILQALLDYQKENEAIVLISTHDSIFHEHAQKHLLFQAGQLTQ